MARINISVRDVTKEIWLKFKAECTLTEKKLGEAITEALELWLKRKKK